MPAELNSVLKSIFQPIYRNLPLKKEAFQLLKHVWVPPQRIYRHLHFHGIFQIFIGDSSFQLRHYGFEFENAIFWTGLQGDWEGTSMRLWMRLCQCNSVIYDVGANTGVFSLVAKTINPSAEVHAFEPVRRVYDKLVKNNELNEFDVHCVSSALSDGDGKATIFDQDSDHIYSVTLNKNLSTPGTKVIPVEVDRIRLDQYCEKGKFAAPTLIKLDVETHEPEVLIGMGDLIKNAKPDFLIEILNEEVGEKIEEILGEFGYLYFNIGEAGKIRPQKHLGKSDHWNFLICKPETAKVLGLI